MATIQTSYCVDDIQRVHKVEVQLIHNHYEILNGELVGKLVSKDFIYSTKENADLEIAQRHSKLNKAFKSFDLLACLSINKEPSRIMEGFNRLELENLAHEDKKNYKGWIKTLERNYEEINHEKPDLEKLSKTLKNANLVKKALENPLAIDFIEIMAKEAQIKKVRTAQATKEISPNFP